MEKELAVNVDSSLPKASTGKIILVANPALESKNNDADNNQAQGHEPNNVSNISAEKIEQKSLPGFDQEAANSGSKARRAKRRQSHDGNDEARSKKNYR